MTKMASIHPFVPPSKPRPSGPGKPHQSNPHQNGHVTTGQFQTAPAPNVLLIASGKGGVGKTWFTISLAHQLAANNKKVLVFDGDLGLANIDIQLGINPKFDLGDVIDGNVSFQDSITHYEDGGFDILAGRSGSGSLAQLSREHLTLIREELKSMARSYDHVLIDLGAGIGGIVKSLTPAAKRCILVLNDEPTSLTDGYAFLKVTKRAHPHLDISVLINSADSYQQGNITYKGFTAVCEKFLDFTPAFAGCIRRDSKIKDAIRHQTALMKRHPQSDAANDIKTVAKNIF